MTVKFTDLQYRIRSSSTLGLVKALAQDQRPAPQPAPETVEKFNPGMAGFTFSNSDLDKTPETLQRTNVN